jgi:RND family efflux transporter MFP subunit
VTPTVQMGAVRGRCRGSRPALWWPTGLPALGGLLVLGLAAAAATSCRKGTDEELASAEVPTITAAVGAVVRGDLVETLQVPGTVTALPNEDVRLASLVAGRVDSLTVAEGDGVLAGQVVARIDPVPYEEKKREAEAALAKEQSALENARLNQARLEKLFERGIAAGKEVEDARAERTAAESAVETARAGLEAASRDLARTEVASPIAGQVVRRLVSVGEQVDGTAAQPILEVANTDDVEVAAGVPAIHLGRLRVGMPAMVRTAAYADRTFAGRIVAIAPAVDPATGTALARIRVPNAEHLLKVGMYAETRLTLSEHKGVLTVPAAALSRDGQGAAVYVVEGDLATRTRVTTGLETGDAVEILDGVEEGQKILISAVHGLGERARLASSR